MIFPHYLENKKEEHLRNPEQRITLTTVNWFCKFKSKTVNRALILTTSQLPLLGQQQHIHILMLLQSSCEDGALTTEQEHQWQADVISGFSISYHLKEGSLLTITSLVVVLKGDKRSLFEAQPSVIQLLFPLFEGKCAHL